MCITDGCTHVSALNGLQHHMKLHYVKGNYSLQELVIVDLFDHSTREDCEGIKGSACDDNNAMTSREEDKEDDLQDNLEDKNDVDDAVAEGNKNLALKINRHINLEDFEEYKKSNRSTDESTG